ncbi:MAG: translation elongation factor Ts [Spirochaetes bacterium]|nr:translation elongation factor Ts [Spirochaetota bacterium]
MIASKDDIKKLRDMTGCGIADCKKALEETNGDFNKAIEYLREKGLAKSVKKADREASEGRVFGLVENNCGILVEINCETDFVGNSKDFRDFGEKVTKILLKNKVKSNENIPSEVEGLRGETVLKLNENIKINRIKYIEGDNLHPIVTFIQMGKDGTIIKYKLDKEVNLDNSTKEILEDIAVTASFYKPSYKVYENIEKERLEKERELVMKELKNDPKFANKPDNVLSNIVEGKLRKNFQNECIMELPYYKDETKNIKTLISEVSKKIGANLDIEEFYFVKI